MHRTASLNEESARYSKMRGDFYLPEKLREQSVKDKQATSDSSGCDPEIWYGNDPLPATTVIEEMTDAAYFVYEDMLDNNVAREQARMILPVNLYTSWVWKMDLHNLLHFLRLRMDLHAQYEVRVYANAIAEFVKVLCPWTWEAFERYQLNAITFTGPEIELMNAMVDLRQLKEIDLNLEDYDGVTTMSKRELREFYAKLEKL